MSIFKFYIDSLNCQCFRCVSNLDMCRSITVLCFLSLRTDLHKCAFSAIFIPQLFFIFIFFLCPPLSVVPRSLFYVKTRVGRCSLNKAIATDQRAKLRRYFPLVQKTMAGAKQDGRCAIDYLSMATCVATEYFKLINYRPHA